jgi:hypothetical protein
MSAITPEACAKHIASLLGMSVTAKKGAATDLKGPLAAGLVDDEQKKLCCVMQFDLPSAGSTGAALSRIPSGAVQDGIKKGVLEPGLMENFQEIANVLTVLTTTGVGRRTILRKVCQGPDAASPEVTEFLKTAKTKIYMQISVPGYPSGSFAIIY